MSELRDPRPPIFGLKLLRWFCPPQLLEEIEGDLLQRFKRDMRLFGERRAQRRFAWNTIRFFRPGIFLRNKLSANYPAMLAPSYFRFAWRNLGRHRLFSFINITGLVVGMTVCLMITNYVLFEQSYDAFHTRRQDIVRVSYSRFIDGEFQFSKAQVFPAIGEAVKNALPEVEEFVRIFPMATYVEPILSVETNDDKKTFVESALYVVDSSFLKVFSLSLLQGDPISALRGEKKILLSASAARKYFGEGEVLNKTVHWDGTGDWLVTGVFEDLPENSHMKFDFLASWMRLYGDRSEWNWDGFYTYLLLKPGTDRAKFQAAMQKTVEDKLKGTEYAKRLDAKFILQPLEDIHLYSTEWRDASQWERRHREVTAGYCVSNPGTCPHQLS